jgi:hypothetical protein
MLRAELLLELGVVCLVKGSFHQIQNAMESADSTGTLRHDELRNALKIARGIRICREYDGDHVITIALDDIHAQRAITNNGLSCSLTEALPPKYSMFEIF